MTSKILQSLLALTLCAALVPGAYAKGGHGGGGNKQDKHHDRDDDRHTDRGHDRDGDHDRDHDKRPAGWDKGKKKGWGDCDVPPGQVKKQGCHPNGHHHVAHDRDYNRDRNRNRDRYRHASAVRDTTTRGTGQAVAPKASAQTREQARRTGGKVYNDDGSWHYAGSGQTTTKE